MMAKVEVEVGDPFLPKESQHSYYNTDVPIVDYEQPPYIVIPIPPSQQRLRICICCLCCCNKQLIRITLLFLVVVGVILWLLWPSHPQLQIVHVQLDHINISKTKDTVVFLDTFMNLKLKIQNQDFIPHDFDLISILVGYRGKWVGSTTAAATFVHARSISYLETTIKLNGTQPITSSLEQEGGIIQEFVPLEIVIEAGARFHFFSISVPIQGMTSCTVNVDVDSKTVASQDCYPEVSRHHDTVDFTMV